MSGSGGAPVDNPGRNAHRCHPAVAAFVKNAGLGFAIPYLHDGQMHDYVPDFLIRLVNGTMLILEVKGYDEREGIKRDAAERWVNAVNADGAWGTWRYAIVKRLGEVGQTLTEVAGAQTAVS